MLPCRQVDADEIHTSACISACERAEAEKASRPAWSEGGPARAQRGHEVQPDPAGYEIKRAQLRGSELKRRCSRVF